MIAAMGLLAGCGSDRSVEEQADAGPDAADPPPEVIDGGGEGAVPPHGDQLCATGPCNYQSQQGCSTGQSCLPFYSSGTVAPRCQAAGARGRGESCTGWNDCAAGLFCAEGLCRKLCCGGDWSACPSGESCIRQLLVRNPTTSEELPAGADLCFPVGTCSVLDPLACSEAPGRSCQIVDPIGNVACAPSGDAGLGQACSTDSPCRAGMTCVGQACRRLCRAVSGLPEPPCPPEEGSCVHFVRDPPAVGECTFVE